MLKHKGAAVLVAVAFTPNALAQEATYAANSSSPPVGMVEEPCSPLPEMPPSVREFNDAFLEPGKPDVPRLIALTEEPDFIAYGEAKKAREFADWAGLCIYREENRRLIAAGKRPDVVFFGDSITENWVKGDPGLFSAKIIGRGVGGQTSAQMLVRFHADVVDLHPRSVHIMAGTNDVAGNGGPTTEEAYKNNITAMVEIARAHKIRVVIASIPPAHRFIWRPEIRRPEVQIQKLNEWLRGFAKRERLQYADYHAVLAAETGAMREEFSIDGVHPNRDGYAAMRALAKAVR